MNREDANGHTASFPEIGASTSLAYNLNSLKEGMNVTRSAESDRTERVTRTDTPISSRSDREI